MIQLLAPSNFPIVNNEQEFWEGLNYCLSDFGIRENDIIIIAHTPISRSFGNQYNLNTIKPSPKAINIASNLNKDPRVVEVILQNSKEIVKAENNILITENLAGIVCANAGVDHSNAKVNHVVSVPNDPDMIASKIKEFIYKKFHLNTAVIISDTVGRALRIGAVNIAIGCAGLNVLRSDKGRKDLFGYELKISEIAVADELASAAELIQGQSDAGKPIVIIRGYKFNQNDERGAKILNRPKEQRLFK
jgi:coenzyme F420-0:L-glutamate ligase / coenzyme F420-1:gamma-L-glutamate ligase